MGAAASVVSDLKNEVLIQGTHDIDINPSDGTSLESSAHKCGVIRKNYNKENHVPLHVVQRRLEKEDELSNTPRNTPRGTEHNDTSMECLSLTDQEMDDYLEEAFKKQDLESNILDDKHKISTKRNTPINNDKEHTEQEGPSQSSKEAWSKREVGKLLDSPRKIIENIQKVDAPLLQREYKHEVNDSNDSNKDQQKVSRNMVLTDFCPSTDGLSESIADLPPVNIVNVTQGHHWYSTYARELPNKQVNLVTDHSSRKTGASSNEIMGLIEDSWKGARPKSFPKKETLLKPISLTSQKRKREAVILNQLRKEGVVQTSLHEERQKKEKLKMQELKDIGIIPDFKPREQSPSAYSNNSIDKNDRDILYTPKVSSNPVRLSSLQNSRLNQNSPEYHDEISVDALLTSIDKEIERTEGKTWVKKNKSPSLTNLRPDSRQYKGRGTSKSGANVSGENWSQQKQIAVITPTPRMNTKENNFRLPFHADDQPTTRDISYNSKLMDEKRMAEIEQLIVDLDISV